MLSYRWICRVGKPLINCRFHRPYSIPPNFTLSQSPGTVRENKNGDVYDLNIHDIADTLDNDPNLTAFYDTKTLDSINNINTTVSEPTDPYDLSNIPISTTDIDHIDHNFSNNVISNHLAEPQTMSTEDFVKFMANQTDPNDASSLFLSTDALNSDNYLSSMISKQNDTRPIPDVKTESSKKEASPLSHFLEKDDIPKIESFPKLLQLKDIVNTELPLIIISKLLDPRLNLSIEKYIYDNFPDPKQPLNKFAKRLFLYRNSNCVVLGKNQNIFREINLRLASSSSIPILRRFSGGGTVVHDLGNFNFAYICPKDEFSRTGFTMELIKRWNDSLASLENTLCCELDVNEKGDMVRKSDLKKVSGSAYQISKGRSLHHGTMLLNSDLKTLSKLLKLDNARNSNIIDRATDSIPSPITNTNMDMNEFVALCCESFTSQFGVPTNLKSKTDRFTNVYLQKINNVETQILKIDDLVDLPDEILETYNQLKSWDWIFGKTPRFQMKMNLDKNNLKLKFDIDKGRVISLEYDRSDDSDTRLDALISALSTKEKVVLFSNKSIGKYISDESLRLEIGWNIDQLLNYERIGVIH